MSTKPLSFTPEKTKQPPRAWERRPATPFVPRDDKQKIWKRIPLGELGLEPNRPVNISRRDREAGKDYFRVVKKLKVGHTQDDEDKENLEIGAKADNESNESERYVRFDPHFVTMKMEEDAFVGSPKKKLRAPMSEYDLSSEEEMLEKIELDIEKGEDESEEDDHIRDAEAAHKEHIEQQDRVKLLPIITDGACDMGGFAETILTPFDDADLLEEAKLDAFNAEVAMTNEVVRSVPALPHDCPDVVDKNNTATVSSQQQVTLQLNVDDIHDSVCEGDAIASQHLPAQSTKCTELTSILEPLPADQRDDAIGSPLHMPEEPRSSSPPTILAENVVVDELESRTVSNSEYLQAKATPSGNEKQGQESAVPNMQESVARKVSDDEAAFLRNFVSVTKAERAAREKKQREMLSVESVDQRREKQELGFDVDETLKDIPPEVEETPTLEAPASELADTTPSSPLRRSKRTATTNIPRPQNLPNPIQLKRANGHEFIFTANKASSVANIAVVTRSNTKRNKGSALSVPERLEQLIAGGEAEGEDGTPACQIDGLGGPDANLASENVSENPESKKHKREGKDGGVRVKKVLRWNDEKLVSYQEAEKNVDGMDDIEDSSEEGYHAQNRDNPEKQVKLTLNLSSSGSGPQASHSAKESSESTGLSINDEKDNGSSTTTSSSSQSKVRRARRGTSGTVNGTPGPKTRSRRILMSESGAKGVDLDTPVDSNGSMEDSTAATGAITTLAMGPEISKNGVTRKSRMPMPVSGARRGAAASASVRTASSVSGAARGTRVDAGSTPAKRGDAGKPKESRKASVQKEDSRGDVLGKRRLRVRS